MKNKKIFYKEGQIMLNDEITVFHFKTCKQNILDDTMFDIIDMYDNLIKIPYRNVLYIFYHANNKRNEGIEPYV